MKDNLNWDVEKQNVFYRLSENIWSMDSVNLDQDTDVSRYVRSDNKEKLSIMSIVIRHSLIMNLCV